MLELNKRAVNKVLTIQLFFFLQLPFSHAQVDQTTPQWIAFFESNPSARSKWLTSTGIPQNKFTIFCPNASPQGVVYEKPETPWSELIPGPNSPGDEIKYCDETRGWVAVNNKKRTCCAFEPELRYAYHRANTPQAPVQTQVQQAVALHGDNPSGSAAPRQDTRQEAQFQQNDQAFFASIKGKTLSAELPVKCPLAGMAPRKEPWSCAVVIEHPTKFDLSFVLPNPKKPNIAPVCQGLYLVRSCDSSGGKTCCTDMNSLKRAAASTRDLSRFIQQRNHSNEVQAQARAFELQRQAIEAEQQAQEEARQREMALIRQNEKKWAQYQENLRRHNYEENQRLIREQLAKKQEAEQIAWLKQQEEIKKREAWAAEQARRAQAEAQRQAYQVNTATHDASQSTSRGSIGFLSGLFNQRQNSQTAAQAEGPSFPYLEQIAMHYSQQSYDKNRGFKGTKNFYDPSQHCYMHVKFILEALDPVNCWNRKIIGGDGTGQGQAKNAGKDLSRLGYRNITDSRAGNSDSRKIQLAPPGSIIVYQDCKPGEDDPGHIEIKARQNYFASDFISSGPQACTGVSVWHKPNCP